MLARKSAESRNSLSDKGVRMNHHRLIIIGAGPAGLTAGIYAARGGLQPLVIEGKQPGGQLMGTSYVENWPGEKKILGVELMMKMKAHAQELGCIFLADIVQRTNLQQKPFIIQTERHGAFSSDALIIASGSSPKRLGCPGEEKLWGKGVTSCAVCDGALYKNKRVVIVGGGDTAMEDASFMTKFSTDITVLQLLDRLTASHAMQQRVLHHPSIKIIYNAAVQEIIGDSHVTALRYADTTTKHVHTLETDAIFLAIGLKPQTDFLTSELNLTNHGFIVTHDHTKTSIEGVFAAGDVADFQYRQAITSAGSGCMAALDAERYLSTLEKLT